MAKQKKTGKQKNQENRQKRQQSQQPKQKAAPKKEETRDVITLEFDDGQTQKCFVEGIFDCGEQDYIALVPDDDSGDVYIYKYFEEDDDEYRLEDEADEAKFAAAVKEYEELVGYEAPEEAAPEEAQGDANE